jgi:CelD/BcsL family acetyltransferase involved in cellulose biosynthesis
MAAIPIVEELSTSGAGTMIAQLAGFTPRVIGLGEQIEALGAARPLRRLAIYPATAGFDLVDELDHLCARTVEPNIFFNPRFLAPAMPRLEDREIRLAVMRDGEGARSRLRMLVPFSVERPGVPLGVPVLRSWANPFGPLGTPLIDQDDPIGVIEDFLSMLARPHLRFPKAFVLPDMKLDGPVAGLLRNVGETRNLPLEIVDRVDRPYLQSSLDGDAYLKNALRPHHLREFRRLKRRLSEKGRLEYRIARQPEDIRHAIETFLTLEMSGWKGRERTAMAVDRYRAAFAREAVYRLSEADLCRAHLLLIDDQPIAVLLVFVENGVAYTWKTAYDETFSAYSPGALLAMEVTHTHLDDPNITATDSCAVPDHPVMSRIWTERASFGTMIVGLTPGSDRAVRQAAQQIHLYRESRNMARLVRNRIRKLIGRR